MDCSRAPPAQRTLSNPFLRSAVRRRAAWRLCSPCWDSLDASAPTATHRDSQFLSARSRRLLILPFLPDPRRTCAVVALGAPAVRLGAPIPPTPADRASSATRRAHPSPPCERPEKR